MTTQSYRDALDKMAGEIRRLHVSGAAGDLAALRRMDPDHPSAPALHRLLARTVAKPLVSNIELIRRSARLS
jgi:hypothetical protein